MPAKHKYKCLNDNCSGSPRGIAYTGYFCATNAPTPVCPACGGMKLFDCGITHGHEGWIKTARAAPGVAAVIKHDDRTLRRIADRHGLTNMSNKDGKPIRLPKEVAADGPKHSFNGIDVPIAAKETGGCINLPGMAQPLTGTWSGAGTPSKMLKGMTNVVAEHKG